MYLWIKLTILLVIFAFSGALNDQVENSTESLPENDYKQHEVSTDDNPNILFYFHISCESDESEEDGLNEKAQSRSKVSKLRRLVSRLKFKVFEKSGSLFSSNELDVNSEERSKTLKGKNFIKAADNTELQTYVKQNQMEEITLSRKSSLPEICITLEKGCNNKFNNSSYNKARYMVGKTFDTFIDDNIKLNGTAEKGAYDSCFIYPRTDVTFQIQDIFPLLEAVLPLRVAPLKRWYVEIFAALRPDLYLGEFHIIFPEKQNFDEQLTEFCNRLGDNTRRDKVSKQVQNNNTTKICGLTLLKLTDDDYIVLMVKLDSTENHIYVNHQELSPKKIGEYGDTIIGKVKEFFPERKDNPWHVTWTSFKKEDRDNNGKGKVDKQDMQQLTRMFHIIQLAKDGTDMSDTELVTQYALVSDIMWVMFSSANGFCYDDSKSTKLPATKTTEVKSREYIKGLVKEIDLRIKLIGRYDTYYDSSSDEESSSIASSSSFSDIGSNPLVPFSLWDEGRNLVASFSVSLFLMIIMSLLLLTFTRKSTLLSFVLSSLALAFAEPRNKKF